MDIFDNMEFLREKIRNKLNSIFLLDSLGDNYYIDLSSNNDFENDVKFILTFTFFIEHSLSLIYNLESDVFTVNAIESDRFYNYELSKKEDFLYVALYRISEEFFELEVLKENLEHKLTDLKTEIFSKFSSFECELNSLVESY